MQTLLFYSRGANALRNGANKESANYDINVGQEHSRMTTLCRMTTLYTLLSLLACMAWYMQHLYCRNKYFATEVQQMCLLQFTQIYAILVDNEVLHSASV